MPSSPRSRWPRMRRATRRGSGRRSRRSSPAPREPEKTSRGSPRRSTSSGRQPGGSACWRSRSAASPRPPRETRRPCRTRSARSRRSPTCSSTTPARSCAERPRPRRPTRRNRDETGTPRRGPAGALRGRRLRRLAANAAADPLLHRRASHGTRAPGSRRRGHEPEAASREGSGVDRRADRLPEVRRRARRIHRPKVVRAAGEDRRAGPRRRALHEAGLRFGRGASPPARCRAHGVRRGPRSEARGAHLDRHVARGRERARSLPRDRHGDGTDRPGRSGLAGARHGRRARPRHEAHRRDDRGAHGPLARRASGCGELLARQGVAAPRRARRGVRCRARLWVAEAAVSGHGPPLYLLPFDQRGSFKKGLFGWTGELSPEQTARVIEAKWIVYDGALAAIASGVARDRVSVLVDEAFGAAILADAHARGIATACPVEKNGQAEFDFEHGEDFGRHIEAMDPTYVKVLVRYNPEGDAALNARQAARLRRLSDYLRATRRRFLFELLVPPEPRQLIEVDGDTGAYDLELRPALVTRAMRELQDAGVEPHVWKLEGLDRRDDGIEVGRTARRGGRGAADRKS